MNFFFFFLVGVRNSLISAGVDIRENLYLTIHDAVIFATDAGQDSENTVSRQDLLGWG